MRIKSRHLECGCYRVCVCEFKVTKHTPGPWLVMGNQRNGHFDFVLPKADDKDFQANARLISVAPELLDTLRFIVEMDEKTGAERNMPIAMRLAKQAIAKAEGK